MSDSVSASAMDSPTTPVDNGGFMPPEPEVDPDLFRNALAAVRVDAPERYGALCCEGVTRQGEFQPCDKTAVAVRFDANDGQPYPVCAFHSRGRMMPLAELLGGSRG